MIILGVDAHKRSHTIVAVDQLGKPIGQLTIKTSSAANLRALDWARTTSPQGHDRVWAVEDCRHLSRRLEADLLAAGERIVRVPPKLMAHVRDSARTYGKSDPIDALAVARAALREPNLPTARLDGRERDVRLLVDYRESLVRQRTALVNSLRWRLHELDPEFEIGARGFRCQKAYRRVEEFLAGRPDLVSRLAREEATQARLLTSRITDLDGELDALVAELAPTLQTLPGCGALTAAKILGEAAGIDRFRSSDAFARYNGTAPLPVWSSNKSRHRLSRTGNRQINAAIHRIALTQARHHDPARDLLKRRKETGKSGREALRILKRHLSDAVYQALRADLNITNSPAA